MKASMILAALAVLSGPLAAQAQDLSAMQRCRGLGDPTARLACYDAITWPAVPVPVPVPQPAPAPVAAAPTEPAAQFGLERQSAKTELSLIESQITGEFEGWEARTIFRLANGQVWQVTDDSHAAYSLRSPKVTIRRGVLGAFYLEVDGARRSPRVKRLQ